MIARGLPKLTQEDEFEIVNLYHLARTALAGRGVLSRHVRMLWASKEYAKAHPEVSEMAAYKILDRLLGWW